MTAHVCGPRRMARLHAGRRPDSHDAKAMPMASASSRLGESLTGRAPGPQTGRAPPRNSRGLTLNGVQQLFSVGF